MRFLPKMLTCLSIWGFSQGAMAAVTCEDILKMIKYDLPQSTITNAMSSSASGMSPDIAVCLKKNGAPKDIVELAEKLSSSSNSEDDLPSEAPRRTMDDEEDFRSSSNTGEEELPERGGSSGSQPDDIREARNKLKAKKPLTASFLLYKILEENKYPQNEVDVHYYLGRSLEALKMYHAAQHHYLKVIKAGPRTQYFNSALPNLVKIARYTGDNSDLMLIVKSKDLTPKYYPRRAKSHLHYLLGSYKYRKGELSEAKQNFSKVSSKSILYLKARYFEGIISNERGKLKSAVRAFRDVYREANDIDERLDKREAELVQNLKDLALLNIASIYYSIEKFGEASSFYQKVDRESEYWPESLFRDAWSRFMLGDLDVTLGKILTVESPYFKESQFVPEAKILKALTYLYLCDYPQVEDIVEKFETRHLPMRDEIQKYLAFYNGEGKKIPDQAWLDYFGKESEGKTALPTSLFNRVLRNQELSGIARHLEIMDEELIKIEAQKPQWKDSVGVYLKKIIEKDRIRYQKRAGRALKKELKAQEALLKNLLNQANFIKIDLKEAQKADYERKAQNVSALKLKQKFNVDFATSADLIYWPFNGEFWADELGYYSIIESSSCNK